MFAVLYLADFALQAALRHTPELWAQPVALLPAQTARTCLSQCTPAALAEGVSPGMTPSQGQARCGALIIKLRSELAENCACSALLDLAVAFSPWVEETAPGICTLEFKGARQPEWAPVAEAILAHLGRAHLRGRVGFAARADLALLAAQSAPAEPGWRLLESARELHGLPLESLEFPLEMREILARWGIRDLAGLVGLGREALAERLGSEVLPLLTQAEGTAERPLRCRPPRESYGEGVEFEQEIETLEPLLFMLRRLLEQIACRLEATYLVAARLSLRLGLAQGGEYTRTFRIPAPTARVEVLFRALHTHLERFTAEQPIVSLHLEAKPCRPPRQQFGLFESALRDPNQFYETLARLTALLGSERVGVPVPAEAHRPDSFRLGEVEVGVEDEKPRRRSQAPLPEPEPLALALQPVAALCLRRFRPPLPAEVELDLQRRPVALTTATLRGRAVAALGPVRLSGDWWDERGWRRAEWELELADGTLCRVYQERSGWYLEGIYD
jgi:protein ImuB